MRRFVCAWIGVLVIAGAATHARAQGVLQNTFDRSSWPTEYEKRTIVIPEQMWQLELDAGVQAVDLGDLGGRDASDTLFVVTPTVAYGINRNVTIGAAQISRIENASGTDAMGNAVSDTSSAFGRGDVFAIARPFNDYDVGFRVDVPFTPDSPTEVLVGVHVVGHVSLTLDRLALFFDGGVRFKAFADDDDAMGTQYAAGADLVYQVNPQLAVIGGLAYIKQTYDSGGQPFTIDSQDNVDLHGAAYYALGNGFDVFGRLGDQLGDFGGVYFTTGLAVFR